MSFVAAVAAAWATDVVLVYLVTHRTEFWRLAGGFDDIGIIAAYVAVVDAILLAVALRLVAPQRNAHLIPCLAVGLGSGVVSITATLPLLGLSVPNALFIGIGAIGGAASGLLWWATSKQNFASRGVRE